MKKNLLFAFFLLSVFVLPLVGSSVVSGNPPPLLTTSTPPLSLKVGSGASEEENIDSMDIYPSNRWTQTLSGGTAEISNGMLNQSDTGDNTFDSYKIERDLRDLDGSIEVRFEFSTDTGTASGDDVFYFWLIGGSAKPVGFKVWDIKESTYADTYIYYDDINGVRQLKTLAGDEQLSDNTWYTLRLDYDILKSQFRYRLYLDSGVKIFDYIWQDIGSSRPALFSDSAISLSFYSAVKTTNKYKEVLIDYVKAPFKEKEWSQSVTPSDADWLTDSPYQAYVQDDIDEYSSYSLVVPFFDSCSGTLFLEMEDIGNEVDGDNCDIYFKLYGVDGDDGGVHEVYEIKMHYGFTSPTRYLTVHYTTEDEGMPFFTDSDTGTTDDNIRLDFDIGTYDDRSKIRVNTRHYIGEEDEEPVDTVGQADLSASVTDPSNEYILKIFYYADFTGDQEFTGRLDDFNFISKDIFSDIVGGIASGIWGFIASIFILIGKFLAGIFKFVGDIIAAAVKALEPFLTAISGAITALQTALSTAIDAVTTAVTAVVTELQGLAAAIATAVWDGIGTALDFITNAIDGIWTAMILIIEDVIAQLLLLAEDMGDFLYAVLEFLIVLLVDLIDAVFDLIFAIWNSVPFLVDVTAVAELFLASFFDLLTSFPDLFADIMAWIMFFGSFVLIIWWFWAFFLSFAETDFNPFEGMGNFIEKCFFNLLPISLLGFEIYVPMGLFFIPLTFFLVLTESAFFIW